MQFSEDIETILSNLHDALYIVDRDCRITYWNKAAEEITGYASEEVLGKSCADGLFVRVDRRGSQLGEGKCPLVQSMEDGQGRDAEVFLHHRSGHRVAVLVRVAPLRDDGGQVVGGVELFIENPSRDAMRVQLDELRKLALIDTLTGVPNRRHFATQIQACLAHLERDSMPFGVLFVDIDHFKRFNDTFGHESGDDALRVVADTLVKSVRPFDTVSRWGGEEFAIVFPNTDAAALAVVAERVRALVEKADVQLDSTPQRVTVSIGGTEAQHGDTIEALIGRADRLMYASKQRGRNCVTLDESQE